MSVVCKTENGMSKFKYLYMDLDYLKVVLSSLYIPKAFNFVQVLVGTSLFTGGTSSDNLNNFHEYTTLFKIRGYQRSF